MKWFIAYIYRCYRGEISEKTYINKQSQMYRNTFTKKAIRDKLVELIRYGTLKPKSGL